MKREQLIAIKGAGDLASGIALRLWRSGYRVIMSELPIPLCIRRTIAFSSAVFDGSAVVENAKGILIHDIDEADKIWRNNNLPIIVDAGIGAPSQACRAMEMGAAAIMANTALATSGDVPRMARAFRLAIESGREAYLAGLGRVLARGAAASDPLTGFLR